MTEVTPEHVDAIVVGVPLRQYVDLRITHTRELMAANDRRYSEVAHEREKALQIKDKADDEAKRLQRETQTYKDEKANELRSQIERERGLYVTRPELQGIVEKLEAAVKPLADYVTSQQGGPRAVTLPGMLAIVVGIGGLLALVLTLTGRG